MKNSGFFLIYRGLVKVMKSPMAPLSGLGTSLFFLIVYTAGIGGIGYLPEFGGHGYLAFIFPLCIVSLAMGSAAGAGQSLHDDLSSGYFRRLFYSPAPRWFFTAAPLLADAAATVLVSVIMLVIGGLIGVPFRFGALSFLGVLGLSFLWGVFLSGLSAGIMIRTGSPQGAKIVTTAVFPLIFLSPTFLPKELITAKWLKVVMWGNPVTYMLEAMRYLLAGTADVSFFRIGLIMSLTGALGSVFFALSGSRKILVR